MVNRPSRYDRLIITLPPAVIDRLQTRGARADRIAERIVLRYKAPYRETGAGSLSSASSPTRGSRSSA